MQAPKQDRRNLVWMDLEMTGLDSDKDTILELATIVTDSQLEVLQEGPCLAIHHPDEVLAGMTPWCREHHGASGLVRRARESSVSMGEAEERAMEFIQAWCVEEASPLCGSSVHQDRRFLIRHMPRIHRYLHYRHIDVSTVKELVARWYPFDAKPPSKERDHMALDDVRHSIAELAFYRQHYFK